MAGAANPSHSLQQVHFWQSRVLWLLLTLLVALPFLVVTVPPLTDLPGHMARYHIMRTLPLSPDLQKFYAFEWRLMGNLGADILVFGLSSILSVTKAAWAVSLLSAIILPLTIFRISRTVHGEVQPTALFALPFIFSFFYLYGFINYFLGLAFAMLALSFWIARDDMPLSRALNYALISFLLWLCHTMAWGVFALCAGVWSLYTIIETHSRNIKTVLLQTLRQTWPLALPLFFMLVWRSGMSGDSQTHYDASAISDKLSYMNNSLLLASPLLDVHVPRLLLVLALFLNWKKYLRMDARFVWVFRAALLTFLMMPSMVFNSQYADGRLISLVAITGLLALRWQGSGRGAAVLASAGLAFFAARIGVMTHTWQRADSLIMQHVRGAAPFIPHGARVLALVKLECGQNAWQQKFWYNHLPELMVLERNVFINSLWDVAGAQSLHIKYNRDNFFRADPSQFVFAPACGVPERTLEKSLQRFPRARFDFVWIMHPETALGSVPGDLQALYEDGQTSLYKIKR